MVDKAARELAAIVFYSYIVNNILLHYFLVIHLNFGFNALYIEITRSNNKFIKIQQCNTVITPQNLLYKVSLHGRNKNPQGYVC